MKHTLSYHKNHPNPQVFRQDYELLNGKWDFVFDENLRTALWHDEIRCATFKGFERFFIKMIVVRMRNKHDVNPREVLLFVGFHTY